MNSACYLPMDFLVITTNFLLDNYQHIFLSIITDEFFRQ